MTGTIPSRSEIASMPLVVFSLANNSFVGEIPNQTDLQDSLLLCTLLVSALLLFRQLNEQMSDCTSYGSTEKVVGQSLIFVVFNKHIVDNDFGLISWYPIHHSNFLPSHTDCTVVILVQLSEQAFSFAIALRTV
ncbi:unnamed protein product [Cylindrotheca closterium]|uniref:Uncharacterized protein n=1 Tax=Cylindrotheca closterium TaxID=2856 RepID=A0AAD2FTE4_9STRA|nr:unnamed protein product [Cylindrotheca closterium]